MMKLTTRSVGVVEDEYAVIWRSGTKRKGILYIDGIEGDDPLVAAELVAIRHLLFTKKIFNRDIISGTGIEIQCSSPLIKKLYRGKSTKKHLQNLSHFMQTSLQGVTLSTTEENDEFLPAVGDDVLVEYISAGDKPQYDVVKTQALGDLRLTKHAIEQYEERHHSGEAKNPLISLVGRLKHPDLKRQSLPDKAARHKLRKYGTIENLEIWGHDTSQMHYVVVRDPNSGIGTLVTIFKRHPTYIDV
ncbi:MAG: hypothetical protein N0E56_15760 [Candidatus Thiodiazotropha endolucinida]|nr:hypothetical protein [Candidatus Thiodiazotropha taylori]MCW4268079.1 hypothetical protein [Candidatus Thiodiazotropha endolucinida]